MTTTSVEGGGQEEKTIACGCVVEASLRGKSYPIKRNEHIQKPKGSGLVSHLMSEILSGLQWQHF